jgi:hypothetical protein
MSRSIVCVGWASLIWEPSEHPGAPLAKQGVHPGLVDEGGSWHPDGPALPLELARDSTFRGARFVSWVVTPGATESPTLWASLDVSSLDEAIIALATREGVEPSQIDRWPGSGGAIPELVGAWATHANHDAVVWTALTPKWQTEHRTPLESEVLALLVDLDARGEAAHAERYIRNTPRQTASPYRTAIEARLGWTPTVDGPSAAR